MCAVYLVFFFAFLYALSPNVRFVYSYSFCCVRFAANSTYRPISVSDVAGLVLSEVWTTAKTQLTGDETSNVVLSAPDTCKLICTVVQMHP